MINTNTFIFDHQIICKTIWTYIVQSTAHSVCFNDKHSNVRYWKLFRFLYSNPSATFSMTVSLLGTFREAIFIFLCAWPYFNVSFADSQSSMAFRRLAVVYAILSNDTKCDISKPHYSFIFQMCPVDCFLVHLCCQSNIITLLPFFFEMLQYDYKRDVLHPNN